MNTYDLAEHLSKDTNSEIYEHWYVIPVYNEKSKTVQFDVEWENDDGTSGKVAHIHNGKVTFSNDFNQIDAIRDIMIFARQPDHDQLDIPKNIKMKKHQAQTLLQFVKDNIDRSAFTKDELIDIDTFINDSKMIFHL